MSRLRAHPDDCLLDIYQRLYNHWGDRKWWPADTVEEVVIGAILVQNVAWSNVETAIGLLKQTGICSFRHFTEENHEVIYACVKSTRFYKMKTAKLIAFANYLQQHYSGSLLAMLRQPGEDLRSELLGVYGIGPETADDIVLYAAELPTFVVDAYTRRIFSRLELIADSVSYEEMRQWFLSRLPSDVSLLNQYHALLDALGHHYCTPQSPKCSLCPLSDLCPAPGEQLVESIY